MITPKPTFDTLCISEDYPTIKGNCTIGVIDVYDEEYNILKSVNTLSGKFFINLEELEFKALLIKNTGTGFTSSEYSNILIKCTEALPCVKRIRTKTCDTDCLCNKCVTCK